MLDASAVTVPVSIDYFAEFQMPLNQNDGRWLMDAGLRFVGFRIAFVLTNQAVLEVPGPLPVGERLSHPRGAPEYVRDLAAIACPHGRLKYPVPPVLEDSNLVAMRRHCVWRPTFMSLSCLTTDTATYRQLIRIQSNGYRDIRIGLVKGAKVPSG